MQQSLTPFLKPGMHPALVSTSGGILAEMKAQLDVAVGPKQIEVKMPKIGIAPLIAEWSHPEGDAKRNHCPISDESDYDFTAFGKYLKDGGLKKHASCSNIQAMKRFSGASYYRTVVQFSIVKAFLELPKAIYYAVLWVQFYILSDTRGSSTS